ncbi:MAG: hypothetical protein Q9196_002401 [Gyalolechia fulgens]
MDSNLIEPTIPAAPDASLTSPIAPIPDALSPPTGCAGPQDPSPTGPLLHAVPPLVHRRKKGPKTVTETISVTISEFYVSFATESRLLTLTDTVFVNETVFNYITLTQTSHLTHTVNNTVPTTVFATTTTLMPAEPTPALAQATLRPVSAPEGGRQLHPVAVAFVALGAVVGSVGVAALAWFAVRRYRGWKARESQRMRGVELQREWEREQEDARARREMGEVDGGA